MQISEGEHTLTPYTKINSKCLKDLNIRHDTIKLPEENISKTFSDKNHTNVFWGQSPKTIERKAKNKQDLIKLLQSKGNHKQNAKTTYRLGENICKWRDQQGLTFCKYNQLWLQSMGSLRVGHDWVTSLSLFTFTHWRRRRQPTPVFLPWESQGQRSLVGCRLWGRTESDTTEAT